MKVKKSLCFIVVRCDDKERIMNYENNRIFHVELEAIEGSVSCVS